MKLNFWQILGILVLIVGVVLVARRKMGTSDTVQPTVPTTNVTP
jgi:drug/metabolite transporter (DMT)-like permease